MNRFLFLLLMVGLLAAPTALAQTSQGTLTSAQTRDQRPMTPEEMQQQRSDMMQRMDRMDRDWADYERRANAIRDTERRATAQRDMQQLREQRDALRRDMTALETAQGEDYMTRQRDVQQRMDALDTGLTQARLNAAENRNAYRQVVGNRLDTYNDVLNQYSNRLETIPEAQRGEAAYELIQLRSRMDDIRNRYRGMARANQATFDVERGAYTQNLTSFERDLHGARDTLMSYRYGTTGMQGQTTTTPGGMNN